MPRLRFGLRWLMVAVALVAVLLEGWIVWRRYTFHRDQAAMITRAAAGLRRIMSRLSPAQLARATQLDFEDGKPAVSATPYAARRMLARMDQMARYHEYAARHPWLPALPEPLEAK